MTLIELMAVTTIIGTLSALAIPKFGNIVYLAQVTRAIGDIRAIQNDIMAMETDDGSLPASLDEIGRGGLRDPWGNPYQYVPFVQKGQGQGSGGIAGQARKDRFLVPLNTTFDLYSMGRDGRSAGPLTASASRDDIVRANDGGYIGLASKF